MVKLVAILVVTFHLLCAENVPVLFECSAEDSQAAGLHCSAEEPCAVFLELSAVEAVGNRVFVTGNLHTSGATLYSILLTSSDSGKTWKEGYARLRSADLDQIQFLDFETGWIAGNYISGTPKDPFFLATMDGGTTWTLRPLFAEGRPGEIEKFYFESRLLGSLLLDVRFSNRYELFETHTGGENWDSKESSVKLMRLPKERPGTVQSWRLRADAATHVYALERSEGPHWQKVASFPVTVGKCNE